MKKYEKMSTVFEILDRNVWFSCANSTSDPVYDEIAFMRHSVEDVMIFNNTIHLQMLEDVKYG